MHESIDLQAYAHWRNKLWFNINLSRIIISTIRAAT